MYGCQIGTSFLFCMSYRTKCILLVLVMVPGSAPAAGSLQQEENGDAMYGCQIGTSVLLVS
jgi:hypothetical protein